MCNICKFQSRNNDIKWIQFRLQNLSLSLPLLSLPVYYSTVACSPKCGYVVHLPLCCTVSLDFLRNMPVQKDNYCYEAMCKSSINNIINHANYYMLDLEYCLADVL